MERSQVSFGDMRPGLLYGVVSGFVWGHETRASLWSGLRFPLGNETRTSLWGGLRFPLGSETRTSPWSGLRFPLGAETRISFENLA